jgi:hypothetical protein
VSYTGKKTPSFKGLQKSKPPVVQLLQTAIRENTTTSSRLPN